jgi:hypothetical protein
MCRLTELFCQIDDFYAQWEVRYQRHLIESGTKKRRRASRLAPSEVMTILIYFHQMRFRDFKTYYLQYVLPYLSSAFPKLVSYSRFVELMPSVLSLLSVFVLTRQKTPTGVYFVDSTPLSVCHPRRICPHRVFKGVAQTGRSSMGWFHGFKWHLIVNDQGEIMAFQLTRGHVDDRVPLPHMSEGLTGKLIADKGYISQPLFQSLHQKGLQLITRLRKNMKNRLMPLWDKLLLRKRGIIESVNDPLKNISQIEHARHRRVANFAVNLVAGLAAYALQPKKPSLSRQPSVMPA